jgi:peptide/nickel transport system substrate-binding protein
MCAWSSMDPLLVVFKVKRTLSTLFGPAGTLEYSTTKLFRGVMVLKKGHESDGENAFPMYRRTFLRLAAGTAATFATYPRGLVAASAASSKKSLIIAQYAEPFNLNPIMENVDRPADQIDTNIYGSLLFFDPKTGRFRPALATKWTQKDPKTWVFELRRGVQFHKGYGEFTADDVEFFVNYVVQGKKPLFWVFEPVEGAKALDRYTVEYKLKVPFGPFLSNLTVGLGSWIVSKRAYKEMGEEAFGRNPVGTGPFEFESWQRGSRITLKRFIKYWEPGLPYLDRLEFRPIPDPFVRKALLETGEVDLIDAPDYKDIVAFRRDSKFEVRSVPGWDFTYLNPNIKRAPFNIKEVRQAIAYAIDRNELVQSVYYGEATPGDNPFPPGFTGYSSALQVYPNRADVSKARELLAKAGFPNGFKTTCITSERPTAKRALEVMASQLAKAGIKVEIQNLETATYQTRWQNGQYDLATEFIILASPDPDSGLYWFVHTGTFGDHGYNNPQVDKWLDEERAETDQQKRIDILRKVTRTEVEDAAYIYFAHTNVVRITKKDVLGVPLSPQELYLPLDKVRWR